MVPARREDEHGLPGPTTALNPVMTCVRRSTSCWRSTRACRGEAHGTRCRCWSMRLPDPAHPRRHHQLGRQRQRIMIAMALILKPALLIADEPTTALDVTTQAEILRLIRDLQRENGTAVLFITHDFGVVAEIADSVAVLRLGEVVEAGPAQQVLTAPRHPYTRMLLAAVPSLTARKVPLPEGADRCCARVASPKCSKAAAGFAAPP
jgi:peptide/nickel transport system ATP-binding protein